MPTLDLDTFTLAAGAHRSLAEGACLLEAASYLAGEPFSDHPACVSPVLAAYGRSLNDRLGMEDRQQLKPYLPRLLNTAGDGKDAARRLIAADWAFRTALPRLLDVAGLTERAAQLRTLPKPASLADDVRRFGDLVWEIRGEAWEARTAARERLATRIRDELAKRGVTGNAAAAAAAVAAAVADAVAVAAAAAAAAAAADAAADAAAAAKGGSVWDAVYRATRKRLREEGVLEQLAPAYAEAAAANRREAIALLGRLIDGGDA